MSQKISMAGAAEADPNCPYCFGNVYEWNGMICTCVTDAENVVVIVDDGKAIPAPKTPFAQTPSVGDA